MTLLKLCRGVCMDKELIPSNFVNWEKGDKDRLCDAMDKVLREAARKGDSWHHINEVIESLYETYPGLKEYKAERFKQACPSGEVFGPYMSTPEFECLPCPDTTIAKAIDDKEEPNESN